MVFTIESVPGETVDAIFEWTGEKMGWDIYGDPNDPDHAHDCVDNDLDGYRVLQHLRKEGIHTPVLILTARGEESDKVLGFRLGADDYVTKPFSVRELLARVRALLRRKGEDRSAVLQVADLTLDPARREAFRDKLLLAILPDTGERYLSTWLFEES